MRTTLTFICVHDIVQVLYQTVISFISLLLKKLLQFQIILSQRIKETIPN